MKWSFAQFLMLIVIAAAQCAWGAEPESSVNAGVGGFIRTMPHCDAKVYILEYELAYTPKSTLLARGAGINYHFDDGRYVENGQLRGVDFGARYYTSGAMKGFYVGGTFGYWGQDWHFIQNVAQPNGWAGKATSDALRLNIDIGDRILIPGTRVSIMPQVNVGKFFSYHSCNYIAPAADVGTTCYQKSEVNYYWFLGLTAGFAF